MIKSWEKENCEIIIGVDMNETINTRQSKVDQLLNNTTLVSLLDTENAPATYNRGKNCIDFILGTPNIKQKIIAQGYLPFYAGDASNKVHEQTKFREINKHYKRDRKLN